MLWWFEQINKRMQRCILKVTKYKLVSWNENRTLIRFHLAGIFNLRPLTIGLDILHTINSFRTSSSISLQLTWLCGDDADLAQLEGDVETVVPHHQVVVQLAPCGGRIEFKNWFHDHDSACWSFHLSWPSWRRPSKENSSICGENLCWMSWKWPKNLSEGEIWNGGSSLFALLSYSLLSNHILQDCHKDKHKQQENVHPVFCLRLVWLVSVTISFPHHITFLIEMQRNLPVHPKRTQIITNHWMFQWFFLFTSLFLIRHPQQST